MSRDDEAAVMSMAAPHDWKAQTQPKVGGARGPRDWKCSACSRRIYTVRFDALRDADVACGPCPGRTQ